MRKDFCFHLVRSQHDGSRVWFNELTRLSQPGVQQIPKSLISLLLVSEVKFEDRALRPLQSGIKESEIFNFILVLKVNECGLDILECLLPQRSTKKFLGINLAIEVEDNLGWSCFRRVHQDGEVYQAISRKLRVY